MKSLENLQCNYLTYVPEQKYTWNVAMVTTAPAQSNENNTNMSNLLSLENLFSVPLYIIIFFFLAFTVTMSLIYLYHWVKYNLNDPFIKNFSIIYFLGLCLLLVPLIFNLII